MSSKIDGLKTIDVRGDGDLRAQYRQIASAASDVYGVSRRQCRIEVKPGKTLPAEVFVPRDEAGSNKRVALVCTHPWAVMGGDMNNNVPSFLTEMFARLGFVTVKFNFRSGTFSRGNAEIADVLAVCRHLLEMEDPPHSIYLVGYSYGSMIANACADGLDEIKGFVGIST